MELVGEREDRDMRFRAALHGAELRGPDDPGMHHGIRQAHMARMKARRRGVH